MNAISHHFRLLLHAIRNLRLPWFGGTTPVSKHSVLFCSIQGLESTTASSHVPNGSSWDALDQNHEAWKTLIDLAYAKAHASSCLKAGIQSVVHNVGWQQTSDTLVTANPLIVPAQ